MEEVDAARIFVVLSMARTSIMNGSRGRVRYVATRHVIQALCEVEV